MNPRERMQRTLSHEEVDRPPLDIGGTTVSGVRSGVYARLLETFGLGHLAVTLDNPSKKIEMADELLTQLGVDTRTVIAPSLISPHAKHISPLAFINEWGVEYRVPEDAPYSYIPVRGPFTDDATEKAVLDFAWPDVEDEANYAGLAEKARHLHEDTPYAVCGNVERSVILELAIAMRGFEDLLVDMVAEPDFYHALMDAITRLQIRRFEKLLDATGPYLDVIAFGDDVGTQNALLVSPAMYRECVKPYHKRLFEAIRAKTDAKIFYHSCGNVFDLIPDFIEIGVDILNPVQVKAKNMDPDALKATYGKNITFWGGVDSQQVLPFGTPDEVRAETAKLIDRMGANGGLVIAGVHNIQDEVPVDNIRAMCEATLQYKR